MPTRTRALVTTLVALCLTVVAPVPAALSQSAGDEQYSDPFENTGGGKTSGGGSKGTTGTQAPAPAAPASSAPAAPTAPSVTALPRTGLDLRPLIAAGLGLLTAGFLLLRWSSTARR